MIPAITTEHDYRRALQEIEGLMNAKRNTAKGERLDMLVKSVQNWERKHMPVVRRSRSGKRAIRS